MLLMGVLLVSELFCVRCCCIVYMFIVCEFRVRVIPSILGLMFMGSVVLFISSTSCVLYFAVSGMKRVYVVLPGLRLRMRLFVCVHICI